MKIYRRSSKPVTETDNNTSPTEKISWFTEHLTRIPFVQKMFFVEHLKTMVHAGLSLTESLDVLAREIENPKFRRVIGEIKLGVEKGNALSEVFAKHPKVFPAIYVKMIAAGETSGKLEGALQEISTQMRKTHELTSTIRGALTYPAVIVVAMIGIAIMMVTVVLPKLMALFSEFDTQLPLATRILIKVSGFMSKPLNLILVLGGMALLIFLFAYSLKHFPTFRRLIHKINLHLPILGPIIKKINLARFSLTLSSLLESTIPIINAIEITAETVSNMIYKDTLLAAAEKLKSGTPLSEILSTDHKIFPPMVTEMVMVGERTGEIQHLLNELADFYNKEVDKTMKNFATIIEPIIIILLGLAVGGMAVAVIMPMYSLVQNF